MKTTAPHKSLYFLFRASYIYVFFTVNTLNYSIAQDEKEIDRWDNWFIMGNKIVFGGVEKFKHSHEIQWRADENLSQLNTLLYEGVYTYSPNKHWEVVPDFRFSFKSNRNEVRLGFGIIRKDFMNEGLSQFVQQLKWQIDLKTKGSSTQAVRYVPSFSYLLSEKYIVGGLVALLYQWGKDFPSRLSFIRAGATFGIIFDKVHTLNITPAFGAENLAPDGWVYSFTPIVQLIIRTRKDYKYLPARYINF